MKIGRIKEIKINGKNMNNIIPIKSRNIDDIYKNQKGQEKNSWKSKKINLNFFENKNLIKELRAKYLPENENFNNSEPLLNQRKNYKNELNDSYQENKENFYNSYKPTFSSIQNEENTNEKLNENNFKNKKTEDTAKDFINNINEKNNQNLNSRNKGKKRLKSSKQKNIVIENRFYTEIINSNILLDNNLVLNPLWAETSSIKTRNQEKLNNKICRNNNNFNSIKNSSDIVTKSGNNQFISLSLKNMKLDSNNQNIGDSSTNKELLYNNKNKEIVDNIFNDKKHTQYNKESIDDLKIENIKMKKELENYEQLITPLIIYINDINRILDQKEINPKDVQKIIKNEKSKSSLYIKNLIYNLNNSKDDIAYKLDGMKQKNLHRRNRNDRRLINLKQFLKKSSNRSAENIRNFKFINDIFNNDKNEKGNYFYEDISDKYIYNYYNNRNINCPACLIGNNISQRGYSPNICCHLEDKEEYDEEIDNNKEE